jgi:hypothetical protein
MEGPVMTIFAQSAKSLKGYLSQCNVKEQVLLMFMRMILAFMLHRGRMSCSSAAGSICSEVVHRGEVTRFLSRNRWRKTDFNKLLVSALLAKESKRGVFLFIIDATQKTLAGKKAQNTYFCSSVSRQGKRSKRKDRRYNSRKTSAKSTHSFTFGLLITPSGIRIPFQIPHYTPEYSQQHNLQARTTAECAAELVRNLPVPEGASVIVLGDSAYESKVVEEACQERGYTWIFAANAERVYEGTKGNRPKLRSRLKDWTSLSVKRIRLRASTGKYASYRRLSKYRIGPKMKHRDYYAYQEKTEVRNVGSVKLVFSTMNPKLEKATPDDVKILITNAVNMSVSEVIELYSLRWQIELFFKELKSTLGFAQYSFHDFRAVETWANLAITTVLFLEDMRITRMNDSRLPKEKRQWWAMQRLHGLCLAYRQENTGGELKYIHDRLKTPGGVNKLKRLMAAAVPVEFRIIA